jgi:hypothetical protein
MIYVSKHLSSKLHINLFSPLSQNAKHCQMTPPGLRKAAVPVTWNYVPTNQFLQRLCNLQCDSTCRSFLRTFLRLMAEHEAGLMFILGFDYSIDRGRCYRYGVTSTPRGRSVWI